LESAASALFMGAKKTLKVSKSYQLIHVGFCLNESINFIGVQRVLLFKGIIFTFFRIVLSIFIDAETLSLELSNLFGRK